MFGCAHGAVAASYRKTIGPTAFGTVFNPTSGGRRAYTGAFPQFTDNNIAYVMAAGGPLGALAGYTLQVRHTCANLEVNAGQTHKYYMRIATTVTSQINRAGPAGGTITSAFVTTALTGTVDFTDGVTAAENDNVGNVTAEYQYTRS